MKFLNLKKVWNGRYLKLYELTYLNKAGREKYYEMVSHKELNDFSDIGRKTSGISIVAICEDKLLLLKEFRMAVGRTIYNLCAGMLEEGESMADCIRRELYEETGLHLKKIHKILPAAFAAVSLSDIKNQIAFVEVEGEFSDHSSDNEDIQAALYTKEEVSRLLETEEFSSRAQIVAYFFSEGKL
ncbi:MAG: NUDIX hydrolase [Lachnospiraceae bacterium]|nr:NUDIX hydrolase [Lachnospiraceae bacterium]